ITTPGLSTAPQCAQRGSGRSGRTSSSPWPHERHTALPIDPCTSITSREPAPLELRDREMSGVRAGLAKHVEAQAVELPHAFRALAEAVDAGDDIWVVVRPDPLGAAEVGDPALRADAGARQHDARLIRANEFCKHGGLVHGFS